ncbi:MAG: PD-(D/E)XK nuclease family protein [Chitinophagaceae bacterium]|nr:MAG: PD-(D/E)XK nuclease family protein [Chitinophagaceae bacterium]
MQSDYFLKSVYNEIKESFGEDTENLTLIFPNRRAGLFYKKGMAEIITKPVWSPEVYGIQDWIKEVSGLTIAEPLELIIELYKAGKGKIAHASFDEFLTWGEMIVKDFDEIDKYLINAEDFFGHLYELKKIDSLFEDDLQKEAAQQFLDVLWNDEGSGEESFKKDFKKWWMQIGEVYKVYRKNLINENIVYEGIAYRNIAESPEKHFNHLNKQQKFVFAGFNALNPAEEKIIQYLKKNFQTLYLTDIDKAFLEDEKHDAAYFFRKKTKLSSDNKPFQNWQTIPKDIYSYGVPLRIGQCKIAGNILKEISLKSQGKKTKKQSFIPNTAVVLADEHLLVPLLQNIPDDIGTVNITMGYPLKESLTASLMEQLIKYRKTIYLHDDEVLFHRAFLVNLLFHPIAAKILDKHDPKIFSDKIKKFTFQITAKDIQDLKLPEPFLNILLEVSEPFQFLENLDAFFSYVLQLFHEEKEEDTAEMECIYKFVLQVRKMRDLFERYDIQINALSLYQLLTQILQTQRVPFEGEPLGGLQLMGFLETRCLDFENIIILGANEGNLPPSGQRKSFIPYHVRKAFGLPLAEEQESVVSYHFYRLLSRARNIYMLYNSESADDSLTEGEKSRFIQQIQVLKKLDKENELKNISLHAASQNIKFRQEIIKEREIKKTEDLFKTLFRYTHPKNVLYPTHIITYLKDPVKFYFRHILKYQDNTEKKEIDPALFGSIFHESMDVLYQGLIKKEIHSEDLVDVAKNSREVLTKQFKRLHKVRDIKGKDLMVFDAIENMLALMIKGDLENLPFRIEMLEERNTLLTQLEIKVNNRPIRINLNGKADRVQLRGNVTEIIDYKTGRDEIRKAVDFSTDEAQEIFLDEIFQQTEKNSARFQTMMYAWLYARKFQQTENINAGIISTKRYKPEMLAIESIPPELFDRFEERLIEVFQEIFNKDIPFKANYDIVERDEWNAYSAYKK